LPFLRSRKGRLLRNLADVSVSTLEPDLLGARLGSRAMLDGFADNLAHPVEPPAGALCSLLSSNDGWTKLCVFNSEFHLLIQNILPFYFFVKSRKGGGTFTVLPQL